MKHPELRDAPAIHELRLTGPTQTQGKNPTRGGGDPQWRTRTGPTSPRDGTIAILYKISNPLVKPFLQTLSFLSLFAICGKGVYFQGSPVKSLAERSGSAGQAASREACRIACKRWSVMYIVDTRTLRNLCDDHACIQGPAIVVYRGFRAALFAGKRVGF